MATDLVVLQVLALDKLITFRTLTLYMFLWWINGIFKQKDFYLQISLSIPLSWYIYALVSIGYGCDRYFVNKLVNYISSTDHAKETFCNLLLFAQMVPGYCSTKLKCASQTETLLSMKFKENWI